MGLSVQSVTVLRDSGEGQKGKPLGPQVNCGGRVGWATLLASGQFLLPKNSSVLFVIAATVLSH